MTSAVDTACRVESYARAVAAGEVIAGRLVRLAAQRHLDDLEQGGERGLSFDGKAARLAIHFFEKFLKLNGGEHEGKPFILQPWQAFIVGSLFGWKGPDGKRRFRTAYIEIGKGNGKSPLVAGIGLKMLMMDDEPRAEVYAAATKKEQSMVLFRDAVAMVEQSPLIGKEVKATGPKGREWNLAHHKSASFFRPISSDDGAANGQSGPRPHCALLDEIHEHKAPTVIDMMRAGTKGRAQALIAEITNSGSDRTTICWQHHQYSAQVLEGTLPNDEWFAYVCQLDPCDRHREEGQVTPVDGCEDCDDWRDESVWLKANPNLGVSVTLKYLRGQVREAEGMPAQEGTVKRLNFCLWTEAAVHAIPMDRWDACKRDVDRAALRGRECYAAIDIGATSDFTSFALGFPHDDGETVLVPRDWADPGGEKVEAQRRTWTVLWWHWLPQRPRRRDPYLQQTIDAWKRQTWQGAPLVRVTAGDVVDYDRVLDDVLEIREAYPFAAVAVDRGFQGAQFCTNLVARVGAEAVVAFPQGIVSMNAPFRELIELVVLGRLHHEGDPVTRWMASNCAAETRGGLMKPSKEHSKEKIDGITAACMMLGVGMAAPPPAVPKVEWF